MGEETEVKALSRKELRKEKKLAKKSADPIESTQVEGLEQQPVAKKAKKEKKEKKEKKDKDENSEIKDEEVKATVGEKGEDDSYNFLDYVTTFEKVVPGTKRPLEDDGIKVIEPKINKKKLTVDDITEADKKAEEREKLKQALPVRSNFAVWIGNLRYSTTIQDLKEFFKSCGKITRVNLPVTANRNKGFAYVDFESEESIAKALALSESSLEGRNVLIKDSKNFKKDGIKAPPKKPIEGEDKMEALPTLFLGNLSFETKRDDIREVFAKFGEIKRVRISTFEDSGKCKGFAWVDFKEQESATNALRSFQTRKLNGRSLKVQYASVEATERGDNLPITHPAYRKFIRHPRPSTQSADPSTGPKIEINTDKPNPNKIVFDH